MSIQNDAPADAAASSASFHERSDDWLALILGRDLQGATLRVLLYLLIAAAVVATIASLVG